MGTLVRRFLTKSPPFRAISSFPVRITNPSSPEIPNLLYPSHPNSPDNDRSNSNPSPIADSSAQHQFQSPIFPSFPFGFPIHPSGILDPMPVMEEAERSDETATVWADSVKKKRKKKMNKHKLKKLRKLLRRKT